VTSHGIQLLTLQYPRGMLTRSNSRKMVRAKLGYFWRHAYRVPHSGPYVGCVVNSDTGKPVIVDDSRLTAGEFEKVKIAETIATRGEKSCRPLHNTCVSLRQSHAVAHEHCRRHDKHRIFS
jgi:hypothetical protein